MEIYGEYMEIYFESMGIWKIYGIKPTFFWIYMDLWEQNGIINNPLWNKHIKHPLLNHGFRGGVISWGIFIGDIHRGYS
jgi:hypothetical protein